MKNKHHDGHIDPFNIVFTKSGLSVQAVNYIKYGPGFENKSTYKERQLYRKTQVVDFNDLMSCKESYGKNYRF